MIRIRLSVAIALFALALATPTLADGHRPSPTGPATFDGKLAAWEKHQELETASLFKGLEWRSIGPVVQGVYSEVGLLPEDDHLLSEEATGENTATLRVARPPPTS